MQSPIVFIHGLWLHPSCWNPWIALFRQAGFEGVNPSWPGEASTVEETRRHPERVANIGLEELAEHHANLLAEYKQRPVVIGHSFGGLIAQQLLGWGVASAAVAIDPTQMKGVARLPIAQLRSALPVLGNPANYRRAFMPNPQQFHRAFANAVSEEESNALHRRYVIPSPARPLFEAAFANFNGRSPARVQLKPRNRGPLLIIAGGQDRTVPLSVVVAAHHRYRHQGSVNDLVVFEDRGHSLTIDHGWREVAERTLSWMMDHGLTPGPLPISEVHIGARPQM
jgi:pimeloyl-ACP methyl ester carboxylesterase